MIVVPPVCILQSLRRRCLLVASKCPLAVSPLRDVCDRLAFEEWFAVNRQSLAAEFSPSKDEAEITVLAMKKYRKIFKVFLYFCYFDIL